MSDINIIKVPLTGIPLNVFRIQFYVATTVSEEAVKQDLWHTLDDFGTTFESLIFHELDYKVFENGGWVCEKEQRIEELEASLAEATAKCSELENAYIVSLRDSKKQRLECLEGWTAEIEAHKETRRKYVRNCDESAAFMDLTQGPPIADPKGGVA